MEMKMVLVLIMCCASIIQGTVLIKNKTPRDLTQDNVVENTKLNQTANNFISASPPGLKPGLMIKLPFAGSGCNCQNKTCSCCAALLAFGFDRQACAVLTYAPSQVVSFDVLVNNTTPSRSTFSSKSKGPRQSCVPILPNSPVGPVDFCVGLFGITFAENKLHVCMNMMTRVSENPVLHLKLDCIDMEVDGDTQLGNNNVSENAQTTQQPDVDVFDTVSEAAAATI